MSTARVKTRPKSNGTNGTGGPPAVRAATEGRAPAAAPARLGAFYAAGPVLSLGTVIQGKLEVGEVGDAYEREAGSVADRVVAGRPAAPISPLSPGGLGGAAQAQAEEKEPVQKQAAPEEKEPVQKQSAPEEKEPVQKQSAPEEKEPVQKQAAPEEKEPIQKQATPLAEKEPVQKQAAPEEKEPVQKQAAPEDKEPVQKQAAPEEKEPVQKQAAPEEKEPVQKQAAPEEKEPVQKQAAPEEEKPVQKQAAPEEKESVQMQPPGGGGAAGRNGHGAAGVSPSIAATIRSPGPGEPIPFAVRHRLEPSVGADLSGVQVHDGPDAHRAAASLNAVAFTHGSHIFLGRSASGDDLGLMAHEAAHVVQQRAAPLRAGPRLAPAPGDIQRLPAFITDRLASYARYIPGYTLLTVIAGFNPLTGEAVERSPMNLVEGVMGLTPFGTVIFDKLREMGVLQAAFDFIQQQLAAFDLSVARIEQIIEAAWDEMDFVRLDPFDYNLGVLTRHFQSLISDVRGFALSLVDAVIDMIKEAAIGVAESLLDENQAWALIKKVLHTDPLRGTPVEASMVEILEDFLRLIGKEQELEQMRVRGTLQQTADWLSTQLGIFLGLLAQLGALFSAAWDAIRPENLANLATNLRSLAAQAIGFLQQVWDFAVTVAAQVLQLIKDALLSWLSSFANDVPGFNLLTVILGRNPFTGEAVPRTARNLIRGFITLLPNGVAIYDQLEQSGTIEGAAGRIEGALSALGISWPFIVGLFTDIWNGLSIDDLIDPIGAFQRIVAQFGEPILRLFAFIGVVLREMFFLILEMMNFPSDLIGSILTNAMQAIEDIKRDPVEFLLNMLRAVKLGFTNFFDNILTHLLGGLADWLFRGLRQAGIEPPTDLSFQSVLGFVLQVLGLTMDHIWEKLAEHIGPETVARIRGAIDRLTGIWNFIRDVQERGVVAIWEYIESQLSNLWSMILEQATQWVMERVINRAIQWLLSLLDPTGIMPVINSFIAFFRAVQSAIEYLHDMLVIVNDYVTTIAAIARGAIEPGAQKMEEGLAHAVPIVIGFLANQFGLGNIGEKISEIVGGIRGLVDRALDWLIEKALQLGQAVLRTLGLGGGAEAEAPAAAGAADPHDHPAFAQAAANALVQAPLAGEGSPLDAARAFAAQQEPTLSAQLGPGLRLRYVFGNRPDELADGDLDFSVVIEPNTTTVTATKPVGCPSPGVSAPGIGNEAVHGAQPPRNRNGPLVHHTQSEHIIPFATARSIRLAVGFEERSRRVLSRFDRGMITLMIYAGAADRKNAQDNVYSAQFEAAMNSAGVPEHIHQAQLQHEAGNRPGAEEQGREAVSGLTSALDTLRASAVGRTKQVILEEWGSTEDGCTQTNGQRRGEAAAVPGDAAVDGAAGRQYDGIMNLVGEALLAAFEQEATQQQSWEGRSMHETGIIDELTRAGYRYPYVSPSNRFVISRPPGSRLRRLTVDEHDVIHQTEE